MHGATQDFGRLEVAAKNGITRTAKLFTNESGLWTEAGNLTCIRNLFGDFMKYTQLLWLLAFTTLASASTPIYSSSEGFELVCDHNGTIFFFNESTPDAIAFRYEIGSGARSPIYALKLIDSRVASCAGCVEYIVESPVEFAKGAYRRLFLKLSGDLDLSGSGMKIRNRKVSVTAEGWNPESGALQWTFLFEHACEANEVY
jgi:hypothetical protein